MKSHLIGESMTSMKADRVGIMLFKKVRTAHKLIFIAKQAIHPLLLIACYLRKTLRRNLVELLYKSFGNDEFLHSIFPWILKHLLTHVPVFAHRFAHFKGRIHHNTIVAVKHFSEHSTHRSANNKVGLLAFAKLSQHI